MNKLGDLMATRIQEFRSEIRHEENAKRQDAAIRKLWEDEAAMLFKLNLQKYIDADCSRLKVSADLAGNETSHPHFWFNIYLKSKLGRGRIGLSSGPIPYNYPISKLEFDAYPDAAGLRHYRKFSNFVDALIYAYYGELVPEQSR